MPGLSKRIREIYKEVQAVKTQDTLNVLNLLKNISKVKFIESVDVSINLGVDPKKSDQVVRGSVLLPKGIGKTIRVAVFTQGKQAEAAKEAGADIVGFEDLAESIKAGEINFDVLIATPDAMGNIGKLGPILGPRGLMPNPKVGTITTDVAKAVNNVKKGQVQYKTDKGGIVHCRIGNVSFSAEDLKENLKALITELRRVKPGSSKGVYLKKVTISTTMGPGLVIDPASL